MTTPATPSVRYFKRYNAYLEGQGQTSKIHAFVGRGWVLIWPTDTDAKYAKSFPGRSVEQIAEYIRDEFPGYDFTQHSPMAAVAVNRWAKLWGFRSLHTCDVDDGTFKAPMAVQIHHRQGGYQAFAMHSYDQARKFAATIGAPAHRGVVGYVLPRSAHR